METTKTFLKITSKGVGPIKLGKSIPKKFLTKEIEKNYIAGYFGDAQPYEGFRLPQDLQVKILIHRGPFQQKAAEVSIADPSEKGLSTKALISAKKGAKVKMIIVESKDVKTDAGVGVGSNINALKSAYPDLTIHPVPPSFGNDECVATSKSLPHVHFYFPTCKEINEGETVTRIILF